MREHERAAIETDDIYLDGEVLDAEEVERRRAFGGQVLSLIPREALARLQILQPAIGCLNRCNFCSQVAGPVTRELGASSLRTIMGGLRGAMHAMGIERVGSERQHKDGVIFPYLDNDIGSYPHLVDYLIGMRSLGGSTRISTVGWSRHNSELQAMHETIVAEHVNDIDGIRFSLTPYTIGWRTNRDDYIADFGNALATYRPLFEQKGVGRRTGCIEMRFAPDVSQGDIEHTAIGGYSMIRCGEYALVTKGQELAAGGLSAIAEMTPDGPTLSHEGAEALHLIGDVDTLDENALEGLFASSPDKPLPNERYGVLAHKGRAYTFANADGPYYCFNPLKEPKDNTFYAVHYYPQTDSRAVSGVLDATRPFLNNLMRYKNERAVGARQDLHGATQFDTQALLDRLAADIEQMQRFSPRRSDYMRRQVMPLVQGLITAMDIAQFSPADLFKYGLVVDTGVIVNQGKAITEFGGLASRPDMPMTPNEEKGYGDVSQSSVRGNTWRISPVMRAGQDINLRGFGRKSLPLAMDSTGAEALFMGFYEWNPQTFDNRDTKGGTLRSLHIPIGDLVDPLEKITPSKGRDGYLMPGLRHSSE